jgi:transketolase
MHVKLCANKGPSGCAAKETGVVVTAEEHQVGVLSWRVSGILTQSPELYGVPLITGAIGVKDRF